MNSWTHSLWKSPTDLPIFFAKTESPNHQSGLLLSFF